MAYVHCHSCDWSQDDFWSFKIKRKYGYFKIPILKIGWEYNPFSLALSYLFMRGWWKPHWTHYDREYKDNEGKWQIESNVRIHNWHFILRCVWGALNRIHRQHWWTWESYKRDPNKVCPECGSDNLDID